MTCTACAARIERILYKNTKVEEANVNFPLKQAEIKTDESLNVEDLIEGIYKAGYSAKVHEEKEVKDNKYKKFFVPFLSLIMTIGVASLLSRGYELQANLVGIFVIIFFGWEFLMCFRELRYPIPVSMRKYATVSNFYGFALLQSGPAVRLSLIHISEPTRPRLI